MSFYGFNVGSDYLDKAAQPRHVLGEVWFAEQLGISGLQSVGQVVKGVALGPLTESRHTNLALDCLNLPGVWLG